ncbi:MAG TPA: TetR/AcrR family transcriptional regulator [Caulobacteraceae bacterium]|jgi:AcrR family transcriptional regulator
MADSPTRRGDKRERTRARLIAATLEVIAEAGFAGASLEAIARRAGVTRGSIYSNFAGRDELMLTAVGSHGMQLDRDFSAAMPLKAQLRGFAERLLGELPAGARGGEMVIGYALYAIKTPEQRAAVGAAYGQMFATIAADLEAQYGDRLAIPPHALALAIQSLAMGVVWQFILSPNDVQPADVIAAFEALAEGAERRGNMTSEEV